MINEEKLWRAKELAEFLNVSVGSVRNLVYRQQIPYRKFGRRCRFVPSDIHKWLEKKKVDVISSDNI